MSFVALEKKAFSLFLGQKEEIREGRSLKLFEETPKKVFVKCPQKVRDAL